VLYTSLTSSTPCRISIAWSFSVNNKSVNAYLFSNTFFLTSVNFRIWCYCVVHPYMALQPLPDLGLRHKTPLFIPICSFTPLSSSSIYQSRPRTLWGFLNIIFSLGGVANPTPKPQPGGPWYPFLSGPSPLTCPAWVTLPVATLPPT
jgi:hypothetical protein